MNMKLSYRDKIIFIVAIVIIILVAGFFLLIKPKFQEVERAQSDLESVQEKREEIDAKIGTLPTIIESMKDSAKQVGEIQEIFMIDEDPYLNENYIRDIMHGLNIDVTAMTTSYTKGGTINRYTVTPKNEIIYDNRFSADIYQELPQMVYDVRDGVYSSRSFPATNIGVTTMSVEFELDGGMRQIERLLDRLAEDEKTIYLNSIEATNDEAAAAEGEENLTGSFALTMYSVTPLNVDKVLEETDEVKPLETPAEETAAE